LAWRDPSPAVRPLGIVSGMPMLTISCRHRFGDFPIRSDVPDSFIFIFNSRPNPMPRMSPLDLKTMLASEKANALAAISAAKLMDERADAMDYYLGDMRKDMPAQDGRSRAVSTDVADTIEGLMPNLMDIFAGSDEVVRFEPVGPEDEAAAQQETDYVNHVFMQQNPGFMVLYSFIKDALLSSPGWSERRGSASRSCSGNDPRPCCGYGPAILVSRLRGALRGRKESRRSIR
jgi:hypothetical protein